MPRINPVRIPLSVKPGKYAPPLAGLIKNERISPNPPTKPAAIGPNIAAATEMGKKFMLSFTILPNSAIVEFAKIPTIILIARSIAIATSEYTFVNSFAEL